MRSPALPRFVRFLIALVALLAPAVAGAQVAPSQIQAYFFADHPVSAGSRRNRI